MLELWGVYWSPHPNHRQRGAAGSALAHHAGASGPSIDVAPILHNSWCPLPVHLWQATKVVLFMSRVEEIQSAIVSLSQEEYAHLRQWFAQRDWEQWDREIEEDAASGKLDFLVDEAVAERAEGRLQEL